MNPDIIMTQEIAHLPRRADDAHKGDAGRIVVIGGACGEVMMVGAPALAALAALRSGAGLVQVFAPESIRAAILTLVPGATARTLPASADAIHAALQEYQADVVALGPGLSHSLTPQVVGQLLAACTLPMVVDADGLNLLAAVPGLDIPDAHRIVLTPHMGEMRRLLAGRGRNVPTGSSPATRREAACTLVDAYGCTVVLKGPGTIVTNGDRLYTNATGNSGMATAGTGDVLTGVIAALLGQRLVALEAAILGVHLHGLAGDFAAEELGRHSLTAQDVVDYLPDAFCEHALAESG